MISGGYTKNSIIASLINRVAVIDQHIADEKRKTVAIIEKVYVDMYEAESVVTAYIERLNAARDAIRTASMLDPAELSAVACEMVTAVRWRPNWNSPFDTMAPKVKDNEGLEIEKTAIMVKINIVNDYTGDTFSFTALEKLGLLRYLR